MKILLIQALVNALISALGHGVGSKLLDSMLDTIEDTVLGSETEIDDAIVLPIIKALRSALEIPDNDPIQK
ncbi:MAG: hypothetical protein ACWGQW_01255 [bacterium]